MTSNRPRMLLAVIVAAGPLVLAGCTGDTKRQAAVPPPPPTLTITPAENSKDVPISAEIGVTVSHGKITSVTMVDDSGQKVDGALRPDGTSWVPGTSLKNKKGYTAQATATNAAGESVTRTTRFITMEKPQNQTQTNLYFQNDQTYGVAMPVAVGFDPPVAKEARAAVQRRLFVTTDPPQPGAWSWADNGRQVSYRAPDYWRPGTKIGVRAALGGLPFGSGSFGDEDRTANATIGTSKVFLEIDNKTKQMSVFQDEKLIRKIPVSMGKSSTPTSSGKMVIMEKHSVTTFDTRGEPNGGYVATVANAQRLTWGGEFIHAAPWSVGDQGYTNVSHGCTNVSDENAAWLMKLTRVGDLVTIRGTEVELERDNGWTVWNVSWDEFIKYSALPVPADLKPAPEPSPTVAPGATAPAAVNGSPGSGGGPGSAPPSRSR